jgi:hypothetical protein
MFTKNVDYVSYFLVSRYKNFPGRWNVYAGLYQAMSQEASVSVKYLKSQNYPQIGSIIRDGKMTSINEGAAIDTVEVKFSFDMPIPLNNIDITIVV